MKILSIVVPCYNSEKFLDSCMETLLPGGARVEILIINDGSKDGTARIADGYAEKYPDIVRVIHKENGGHGSGVNAGIRNASGKYIKVVDSDDHLDVEAYAKVLDALQALAEGENAPDLVINNYVYDNATTGKTKPIRYRNIFPTGRLFQWKDVGKFRADQNLMIHSLIYRTELLREIGFVLPEKTYYVDLLYAYEPLPRLTWMYYIDADLYRYTTGQQGQSVSDASMIRNADQMLTVDRRMVQFMADNDAAIAAERPLKRYMLQALTVSTVITTAVLIRSRTQEALEKKNALWAFIHSKDTPLLRRFCKDPAGIVCNLPGRVGRRVTESVYLLGRKVCKY